MEEPSEEGSLGLGEGLLAEQVGVQRFGPVFATAKRAEGDVYKSPGAVSAHLRRNAIEAPPLAHEHDSVAVRVEVMRGLSVAAVGHEEEAVVLEVHLAPVRETAAPVAHAIVLEKAGADDVVGRLFDAHGALEHAPFDGSTAKG